MEWNGTIEKGNGVDCDCGAVQLAVHMADLPELWWHRPDRNSAVDERFSMSETHAQMKVSCDFGLDVACSNRPQSFIFFTHFAMLLPPSCHPSNPAENDLAARQHCILDLACGNVLH